MTLLKKLLTMTTSKPLSVIIEGNIACGKTTFLNHFKKFEDVAILTEPVEMWRNCRGHNLLDLMYKDPKQWAFPFQQYTALTMLNRHIKTTNKPIKFMERSVYSARYIFVEKLTRDGVLKPEHNAILDEYFKWMEQHVDFSVDLIVYLRCSPEVAYARMKKRARNEEKSVPFSYIEDLHHCHERWLYHKTVCSLPAPVVTLNANLDLSLIADEYKKCESHILQTATA